MYLSAAPASDNPTVGSFTTHSLCQPMIGRVILNPNETPPPLWTVKCLFILHEESWSLAHAASLPSLTLLCPVPSRPVYPRHAHPRHAYAHVHRHPSTSRGTQLVELRCCRFYFFYELLLHIGQRPNYSDNRDYVG